MGRDLTALFDPRSVAVVGASDDPAKYGHAVAAQALRAPDRRPVHLVNRRGGTVLGRTAATSLSAVGEPVDLVVVSVPGAGFEAAVDEALACGAKAIVAITAGFAEAGPAGLARQRAVADRVRAAGAVLVGPNCLGIADNTTELYLASDRFAPGGVALLSQSGNLALELQLRGEPHGLGYSRFVSSATRPTSPSSTSSRTAPATRPPRPSPCTPRTSATAGPSRRPPPRRASRWCCSRPAGAPPPPAAPSRTPGP